MIRLSKSKENIVGIKNRTTLDLDFSYRLEDINEEEVKNKIINILNIEVDDDIDYDFLDISPITEYKGGRSGYRVRLNATTGNIKKIFGIDIVCGDVITPNAIKTIYTTNITEEEIDIYSYNKETILAEKFQSIIAKNIINSTGEFVKGGSYADSGLTGRKLQCDSYGGLALHGGGAWRYRVGKYRILANIEEKSY